jgi:hypothetical protein
VTFRFDAPLFIANVNRFIEDADTPLADGDPAPDAALVSAQESPISTSPHWMR